jgi:hypothetical protein
MNRDQFTREWIIKQAIEVCRQYSHGILTLRGLHYQLVARGMTNSIKHYKRVVSAMIDARRAGIVAYEQFSDHDREAIGHTQAEVVDLIESINEAERQVVAWMNSYRRSRWENQPNFVEVWIEKKALQGVFGSVCNRHRVAICPCKGYPSLTFLNDAARRFAQAEERGQNPVIVYFGDHDPSGEDIPRSIGENLAKDFGVQVAVDVIALTKDQCLDLKLPPAPIKGGDSRSASFTGLGQIELDAVKPEMLREWAQDAIAKHFDEGAYDALMEIERSEREEYKEALRIYVSELFE